MRWWMRVREGVQRGRCRSAAKEAAMSMMIIGAIAEPLTIGSSNGVTARLRVSNWMGFKNLGSTYERKTGKQRGSFQTRAGSASTNPQHTSIRTHSNPRSSPNFCNLSHVASHKPITPCFAHPYVGATGNPDRPAIEAMTTSLRRRPAFDEDSRGCSAQAASASAAVTHTLCRLMSIVGMRGSAGKVPRSLTGARVQERRGGR